MRINKYLASSGLSSRRKSEELVTGGRVKVNGRTVTELATEINETDIVTVDGVKITPPDEYIYLMLNKPKGCITTTSDERGRKTVMDLLGAKYDGKRLFPVGRLDYDSEGLLIITNDGDAANRMMHPGGEVKKTYIARIEGQVTSEELKKLSAGIMLDGVRTKRCKMVLVEFKDGASRIEIVLTEGRNREIRRLFESIGRRVEFLKRVSIGRLRLGGLSRGEMRSLRPEEINYIKSL